MPLPLIEFPADDPVGPLFSDIARAVSRHGEVTAQRHGSRED
jgi:hypothetical protein